MNNNHSITARLAFDFKGQHYQLETTLDLAALALQQADEEHIYQMLARANHIDPYSYEYEAMQSYPIVFCQPQGLATDFLHQERFDFDGFYQQLEQQQLLEKLEKIATEHMAIKNLEQIPGLRRTLLAVYYLER